MEQIDPSFLPKVISAFEIDSSALDKFYEKAYPTKYKRLSAYWKWLYRPEIFSNKTPLLLVSNSAIVGHLSSTPVEMRLADRLLTVQWFADFIILPEFQRSGGGKLLTAAITKICDIHITFCNHKSLGVFKKLGFHEKVDIDEHIVPLIPMNGKKWIQKIVGKARIATNAVLKTVLYPYANYGLNLKDISVGPVSKNNVHFFYSNPKEGLIKDERYFDWRVLQSPVSEQYVVMSFSKIPILLMLRLNSSKRLISVVAVSNKENADNYVSAVASAALWGMSNHYLNLKLITSCPRISVAMSSKLRTRTSSLKFAYFSNNSEQLEQIRNVKLDLDMLDSDFDIF